MPMARADKDNSDLIAAGHCALITISAADERRSTIKPINKPGANGQ